MRLPHFLLAASLLVSLAYVHDAAEACGGCFAPAVADSEVVGHAMIFSISQQQTTLWDEIQYSGDPASFAWVLPIKGPVTVATSSDALFSELASLTQVTVVPPTQACPNSCFGGAGGLGGAGGSGSGVEILAQETVGPYDTVQLSASDPNALVDWLDMNGYAIPSDVQPVIDAYVNEQFDFLALKLIPGKGISEMRPVSVTTPGASAVLPLRMVAAGTGAITPITLFVIGEGRYEPQNLPWFVIDPNKVVWDFATNDSNYDALVQAGFAASANKGWAIEDAAALDEGQVTGDVIYYVTTNATESGYGDGTESGAMSAAQADLATLFAGISAASAHVTRMRSELSRAALGADLQIGAAKDQSDVSNQYFPSKSINAPQCPPDPCGGGTGGAGGVGGGGSAGAVTSGGAKDQVMSSDSSCSASELPGGSFGFVALFLTALGLRRRAKRS